MSALPRLTPRPWTALLVLAVAACGAPEEPAVPGTIDLLRRRPDSILVQPGELTPDSDEAWGPFDRGGWGKWASATPSGELVVWSMSRHPRLVLAAGPPVDRDLVLRTLAPPTTDLEALRPDGSLARTFFTVRLNDFELGEVDLTAGVSEATVLAPAAVWRHGDNILELEPNRTSLSRDELWHGLGLASVRYGEAIEVSAYPEADVMTLSPRAAVAFTFALRSESKLEIGADAEAQGELLVRMRALSAVDGSARALSDEPLRLAIGERLDDVLPLPRLAGEVLEVQLAWECAEAGAELEINRLVLSEARSVERTPIIFISVDTLAARNMSLYGYRRATTPRLEEFASEAVTFKSCRSNAPRTYRSYLSQLSGLHPHSHYIDNDTRRRWRPPIEESQLAPNRLTLAEFLRAGGWHTAAWVDNPWLANGVGLRQGFDLYDVSASELEHWGEGFDPDGGVRHVVPMVRDWLTSLPAGEPFFAFLQVLDIHGPYLPVDPWKGTFTGDEYFDGEHEAPVAVDQVDIFGHVPSYVARGEHPTGDLPATIRTGQLVAKYDEKILELDHELGLFFDFLRAEGLYDRSIIVFSADHGESLLEHDFLFGHGTLYDESIGVPLVIRMPGGEGGGRVVETPVQLVDLYPTLAELAGIDIATDALHGRSLVPALRGETLPEVPLFAEGGIMRQYSIVFDGWKLIESEPTEGSFQTMLSHERVDRDVLSRIDGLAEALPSNKSLREFFEKNPRLLMDLAVVLRGPIRELYHIATDPLEEHDVAAQHPERVAALVELLDAERARIEEARARAAPLVAPVELSAEDVDVLVQLGYLDGDELVEGGDGPLEDGGEREPTEQ